MATKKYVSIEKLGLYDEKIKKVITDGDSAALTAANAYADSLAVNYDAAGAAATAEGNAKSYTDTEVAKANGAAAAAQAAAEAAASAASVADSKAVAAQGEVDALEAYVGEIPTTAEATNIVAYIQEKTAGIATDAALGELTNRVAQAETDIDNIEKDYLKAADKTELEGKITNVQTAVDTEKGRAEGIEAGLRTDVNTILGDYLKAADKTELQGNINTVNAAVERLTNGVSADEVDGVNDLIKYVEEHGTEVTGMQGDIAQNASDIAGVAGRVTTLEGEMDAVQGAVATKVEQSVYEEKIAALEGADSGLSGRIATLEGKFGGADGSVEDMIADAKAEAIATAGTNADTKDAALKVEIETAYKKYADDEDAKIESRVDALETDTHTHGNKALLDTYTQTEANLADAVAKKHEHANKAELDLIASGDKAKWDAAEGNAKSYADAEVAKDRARLDSLEAWHTNFIECSEEDINNLFA